MDDRLRAAQVASEWIDKQANKDAIYIWMKHNGIGESAYGQYLDAMGRGKGVFHHRLFGHHPLYDFPWSDPSKASDFLEHVCVSDGFTKQGLPIIPGDFLRDERVVHYCSTKTAEWNFINGFDLLSGTLAIYAGYRQIKKFSSGEVSIEALDELAKELSIGTLELAVAMSHCNPLLFFGACLHLAGTLRGVMGDSAMIYFATLNSGYLLSVAPADVEIEKAISGYALQVESGDEQIARNLKRYQL